MLAHYLPQMYLSRFAAGDFIHVYDRDTKKLRRDRPRNVAAITDYYTLVTDTGRNDEVEYGFLAGIEGAAAPALTHLTDGEIISDHEHAVIAVFLALLCVRVPSFENAYSKVNEQLARSTFRHLAGTPALAAEFLARQEAPVSYSAEAFSAFVNSDRFSMPPDQNERVLQMVEMAQALIVEFEQMDWSLLRTEGDSRFITSDAPLGLIPLEQAPEMYGPCSRGVLRFFALSPDRCLLLMDRRGDRPVLSLKLVSDEDVSEINAAIALSSTRLIIGRDRCDVEAVIAAVNDEGPSTAPSLEVVEWDDDVGHRSFTVSVAVRQDTPFPLELPIAWRCRECGRTDVETLVVSSELTPADPLAYSRWLDRPCDGCGKTPRRTASTLTGKTPTHIGSPQG